MAVGPFVYACFLMKHVFISICVSRSPYMATTIPLWTKERSFWVMHTNRRSHTKHCSSMGGTLLKESCPILSLYFWNVMGGELINICGLVSIIYVGQRSTFILDAFYFDKGQHYTRQTMLCIQLINTYNNAFSAYTWVALSCIEEGPPVGQILVVRVISYIQNAHGIGILAEWKRLVIWEGWPWLTILNQSQGWIYYVMGCDFSIP